MARSDDCYKCYHRSVCDGCNDLWGRLGECSHYINSADVAPRAEVAREIFEEIEKYMMDSVDVTHTAYKTIGTSTFAILKKKYTEGEK